MGTKSPPLRRLSLIEDVCRPHIFPLHRLSVALTSARQVQIPFTHTLPFPTGERVTFMIYNDMTCANC